MHIVPGGGVRERNVKIDLIMLGKSRLTSMSAEWNVCVAFNFFNRRNCTLYTT